MVEAHAGQAAVAPVDAPVPVVDAPVESTVSEETAKNLRAEATGLYRRMQSDWFAFAQKVAEISETRAYMALGLDSFRAFCVAEFPELNYVQMTKMVQVVKEFGPAVEARLLAAPEEPVPPLEQLYMVVRAKHKFHDDKVAHRKIGAITAKVLTNEMPFSKLKESLEALRAAKVAPVSPAAAATAADVENDLVKDLKASGELEGTSTDAQRAARAGIAQVPAMTESVQLLVAALKDHPEQGDAAEVEKAFARFNDLLRVIDEALDFYDKYRLAKQQGGAGQATA